MSDPKSRKTLVLIGVDTEASMAGLRPLPMEAMVYGRLEGGVYGIERIMDVCEALAVHATFFVDVLEALHYGDDAWRAVCGTVLERGHDVQLHVHPIWLGGEFTEKALAQYDLARQREAVQRAVAKFHELTDSDPLAHRAGGLWANADTLRAVADASIPLDASVAPGYHDYDLGPGLSAPNVPRALGSVVEVPVTTFAQLRFCGWQLRRNVDINADSLAELRCVLDRAVAGGVTAVSLLMHSFSFIGRNADSTRFWPEPGEIRKFESFLEHVAARDDVEVVTFREFAERLETQPELLDGPAFHPTTGLLRTYARSWERFHTGWKSRAFAVGLPVVAAGVLAGLASLVWWMLQ
jgi:hypothetical protein